MSFQFQQMTVETDFTKTHKLVYGEAGTGKTTFANAMVSSEGKPPFFVFTEKGNGTLKPWGQQITTWDGFLKLKDILLGQKKQELMDKFGCLVFDVAGELDEMCARWVASTNKVKNIADLPHGKGWAAHEEAFKDAMKDFFMTMPCVLTAHVHDKEFLWNGEMVKALAPRFSKRIMYYVNGKVDFIMYMQAANSKKEHREITMVPELGRVAKARYPHMNRAFRNHKDDPKRTWNDMVEHFKKAPSEPVLVEAEEHPALHA